ncbi:bifunctional 3-phenylpropionate/cinnamic acid dioxygenase ferredoxin subunit [Hoyosella altamirensis]|uniref:3-phenylpropionate/trans-cinnamate dioxygenase ferredoxin subunit n=1 Tax=Hoyosella altamirensis TaxID=616997 RepID=A0A839RSL5_9ACTN|nr:bifunctional 3-phenylpropionate/cinnamic acid dioxygenase ferredoxin subunit [Hoyosella altamirensis]MBB3039208.1 3-phenylpropionate/trans-cinnamate dioxygenase ferredoxin subunit [Hoyosella altamirensis]
MIRICTLSNLPPGEAIRVQAAHTAQAHPPIAVFHTEAGEIFAVDDTCTHQDASLADGWLEGCEIECPLHESKFNLRTGQVDSPPAKLPIRTHTVHVADDHIYVEISTEKPNLPPGVKFGVES